MEHDPDPAVGHDHEMQYDYSRLRLYARFGTPLCPTSPITLNRRCLVDQWPKICCDRPNGSEVLCLRLPMAMREKERLSYPNEVKMGQERFVKAPVDGVSHRLCSKGILAKTSNMIY